MNITIDLIKKLRDLTLAPLWDCKEALVEANGDLDQAQEILKKKGAIKADKKSDRETNNWVVKFVVKNNTLIWVKLLCETDFVSKNDSFGALVDSLLNAISLWASDVNPDNVDESLTEILTNLVKDQAVTIGEAMRIWYVIKQTATEWSVYAYNHMGNTLASAIFYQWSDDDVAKNCALQVAAMAPMYVSVQDVPAERISSLTAEFTEEMASSDKPADIKAKIIEGRVQKSLQDDILLEQVSIKDQAKKIKELLPQWFVISSMLRVAI
jgi:elongation factor Ts